MVLPITQMYSGTGKALAAVVLAVTLALSGCGGSSDEEATAGDAPSKAEFLRKANAICRRGFAHINTTYGEFSKSAENSATEAERNEEALKIVPPTLTKVALGLRALEPPSGDEEHVDKMLTKLEESIEEGEEDALAVRGIDGFVFEEAYEKLWAYGLTGCGLNS